MSLNNRRTDRRTGSASKSQIGQSVEALESRELMTTIPASPIKYYTTSPIPIQTKMHGGSYQYPFIAAQSTMRQIAAQDNTGKILQGQDRDGNQWTITVQGPGSVVVTDTTPNDGVLMDDIDTIQIVGGNIKTTRVTGQVSSSNRTLTNGMVQFQHLIAQNGINSIVLNGVALAQTVPSETNATTISTDPNVYLPGGVRTLQIADINAYNDIAKASDPFQIIVGDPSAPLKFAPIIRVGTIYNTNYDSTTVGVPATPSTEPSVDFQIYGPTHALTTNAITHQRPVAGLESKFPPTGTQGETTIATTAIGQFQSIGGVNFTRIAKDKSNLVSKTNALDHAGLIHVGGTADALSVSANGAIRSLRLMKGLGNPNGTSTATTSYGTTLGSTGFPAAGYMGGQINAGTINRITMGAANTVMLTSNNPNTAQTTNGSTAYTPTAGNTMTLAAITTEGSIGTKAARTGAIKHFGKTIKSNATGVKINGNLQQSELAAGFNYNQFVNGVSPLTGPSVIKGLRMRGSLVDSAISASYSPNTTTQVFNDPSNQVSPGAIHGNVKKPGLAYYDGRGTALGRLGSGVFARHKKGALPPANPPLSTPGGTNVLGS
jgi:hypothetical protein